MQTDSNLFILELRVCVPIKFVLNKFVWALADMKPPWILPCKVNKISIQLVWTNKKRICG